MRFTTKPSNETKTEKILAYGLGAFIISVVIYIILSLTGVL